jgi:hypothetical protein
MQHFSNSTFLCRGRDDKTGYEPRGLFNVVEFVMNDKKGNGFISLEEAMQVQSIVSKVDSASLLLKYTYHVTRAASLLQLL